MQSLHFCPLFSKILATPLCIMIIQVSIFYSWYALSIITSTMKVIDVHVLISRDCINWRQLILSWRLKLAWNSFLVDVMTLSLSSFQNNSRPCMYTYSTELYNLQLCWVKPHIMHVCGVMFLSSVIKIQGMVVWTCLGHMVAEKDTASAAAFLTRPPSYFIAAANIFYRGRHCARECVLWNYCE